MRTREKWKYGRKPEVEFLKERATSDTWKSRETQASLSKARRKEGERPKGSEAPTPWHRQSYVHTPRTHARTLARSPPSQLSQSRGQGPNRNRMQTWLPPLLPPTPSPAQAPRTSSRSKKSYSYPSNSVRKTSFLSTWTPGHSGDGQCVRDRGWGRKWWRWGLSW